jgi:hypothetical protein
MPDPALATELRLLASECALWAEHVRDADPPAVSSSDTAEEFAHMAAVLAQLADAILAGERLDGRRPDA